MSLIIVLIRNIDSGQPFTTVNQLLIPFAYQDRAKVETSGHFGALTRLEWRTWRYELLLSKASDPAKYLTKYQVVSIYPPLFYILPAGSHLT